MPTTVRAHGSERPDAAAPDPRRRSAHRSVGASSVEYGLILVLVSAVSLVGMGVVLQGVFERAVTCISRAGPGMAAEGAPECGAPGGGEVQPTGGGGPGPTPTGPATVQPTPCPTPSDPSSVPPDGCVTPTPSPTD